MSVTAPAAEAGNAAAQGKRRDQSLVPRLIAAVLFLPCLVVITLRGDLPFLALIDLIILTGILEFYALLRQKGFLPSRRVGALCALSLSWYAYFRAGIYANFLLALALLLLMVVELIRTSTEKAVVHISVTMFGVLYVGWLGSHFVLLRELPRLAGLDYALGADFVLLAILLTWSSDTGAYLVGRRWGRTPLFPRVSPKKSREGALGGVALALIAAFVAQRTFADYLELPMAFGLAALAAVAGLAGDLVESLLKRGSEAKDSGDFIPGHGGSLDRFDSLLFSVPLIYYFHKFFVI
jgi:phosphatidate cytidylyltransferase